jgi:hypothetical protein
MSNILTLLIIPGTNSENNVAKQFTTIIKNETKTINEAKKLGIDFYDYNSKKNSCKHNLYC